MSKFLKFPLLLLAALLFGACASTDDQLSQDRAFHAELAKSLGESPSKLLAVSTGVWFPRYEEIGHYDISLYQLPDPGISPDGFVVLFPTGIGFSSLIPHQGFVGILNIKLDEMESIGTEDGDRVLSVKTKDGRLYIFQLGGSRVDTKTTKAFSLTLQTLLQRRK